MGRLSSMLDMHTLSALHQWFSIGAVVKSLGAQHRWLNGSSSGLCFVLLVLLLALVAAAKPPERCLCQDLCRAIPSTQLS